MGIDLGGLADKAKDLLGGDALKSEQAEGISDAILDKAEDAASGATGGKFDEQISGARDAVDSKIGNE